MSTKTAPLNSQSGFTQLLIIMVIIGLAVLGAVSNLELTKSLITSSKDVKGVFLARGGDDSGGESGSGGSQGGESSSGSSGSSGSSTSTSSGGDNNSSSTETKPSETPKISNTSNFQKRQAELQAKTVQKALEKQKKEQEKALEKAQKLEDEKENELENELEDELEKVDGSKIKFKLVDGELEIEVEEASGSTRQLHRGRGRGGAGLAAAPEASGSSNRGPGSLNRGQRLKLTLKQQEATKEVEIEAQDNEISLISKGARARSNFPLSIDNTTDQLMVQTGKGLKAIRVLPDQAAQKALEAGVQNQIESLELAENTQATASDEIIFRVKGIRLGTLFGFIPVSTNVETQVGAQTGTVLETTQPFWLKLFSSFVK